MQLMNNPLLHAISLSGGQMPLAKALAALTQRSVSQGMVWYWLNKSKKGVPAEYCRPIEQITNGAVTAHDLRSDIFPPPARPESKNVREAA